MKRILVTGGAGFIGTHLCKRLLNEGNDVICLDNYFTGSKQNVIELVKNPNFELVRHDITYPYYAEVDEIYNLACPASPVHYKFNPIKTVKTSVIGSINMLGLAKRVKAKILQASTSEIYGDPLEHPQNEAYFGNVNTMGQRSCYDEGKRCAETLFMDYHRQNKVDIRIARIFNTYGPYMHPNDGRVVSNFIMQALQNKNITIYGSGRQTRSFQYINDLLDGLILLMNSNIIAPINLGNPIEITIQELAEKIIDITGSRSKIEYLPPTQGEPIRRQPDISFAKKELNWVPKVDLDTGLKQTIEYFKKYALS